MNETTTQNTGEVAVVAFQAGGAAVVRSEEAATLARLNTVRATLAPDLTDNELQLFAMVAVRSGLDPFARQIFAVKRNSGRGGAKMTIQTGIDGYRSIAARTGEYDGQDEPSFGPMPCPSCKGPHPESATVRVYRKGISRPIPATAFWHEYVPAEAFMWTKMPRVMIAKVAEALALRKAFPWDPTTGTGIGGDIYTPEEMAQADVPEPTRTPLRDRIAARVEGLTVREFADAVHGMDPERIREVRSEMFPDVAGVADLSGEARMALLFRLREPVEEVVIQEADAAPGSFSETVDASVNRFGPESDDDAEGFSLSRDRVVREDPAMVACEVPSPFDAGTICLLAKGHRGAHRAGADEAWPR